MKDRLLVLTALVNYSKQLAKDTTVSTRDVQFERQRIAQEIYSCRANHKVSGPTLLSNKVETWVLRNLPAAEGRRHYVTQIKNCHGEQVGDAMYAGNKHGAAWNHLQALESIL